MVNGQNGERAGKRDGRALSSRAAERVYGQHSGYRKLKAYQVAELVYDFTCRFCARYIPRRDRHHDRWSRRRGVVFRISQRAVRTMRPVGNLR